METTLHRKIKACCKITRDKEKHWALVGSQTVWVPEASAIVTTRRAAYAAFIGPVASDEEVRSTCGVVACIRPDHAELCKVRRAARPLALPEQVAELSKAEKWRPLDAKKVLPHGVTLRHIDVVKHLSAENSLKVVAAAVDLPIEVVAKIHSGAYDGAAKNVRRTQEDAPVGRGKPRLELPAIPRSVPIDPVTDPTDQAPQGPKSQWVDVGSEPRVGEDVELSEEEAWLEMVRRG